MKLIAKTIVRRHFWQFICLAVADILIFCTTDTENVSSFVLGVGFVLFGLSAYYLLNGLLTIPGFYGLPIKHKRRLLATLTILASGLVALQSIGQLAYRDVLVISFLTFLAYIYSSYTKATRHNLQTKRL
jgi:hypothetical protein